MDPIGRSTLDADGVVDLDLEAIPVGLRIDR